MEQAVVDGNAIVKEAFGELREGEREMREAETKETRGVKVVKLIAAERGEWGLTEEEWGYLMELAEENDILNNLLLAQPDLATRKAYVKVKLSKRK